MLNWMKQQRKLMNKGELKPERLAAFKRLMAKGEKLKRVNQWTVALEDILKSDVLRNYQQEMINRLGEAWRKFRSVMVQMPTGTGKTVLMAEVIKKFIELKKSKNNTGILIVAHRREGNIYALSLCGCQRFAYARDFGIARAVWSGDSLLLLDCCRVAFVP